MRFCLGFLLLYFLASPPSFARQARAHSRALDSSYSSALAAANRFLHAWQTQDHETGIMMLTDAARQAVSSDKLQEFFSPSNHAAYEIQRGRRLNGGEYVFPVVLYGAAENSQPRVSRLVIMRTRTDEWVVNRLP
jgi:hypothetical protein